MDISIGQNNGKKVTGNKVYSLYVKSDLPFWLAKVAAIKQTKTIKVFIMLN